MAATVEEFRARFTEFSAVVDATVQLALDDALLHINSEAWGSRADEGQMWLAAHLLKVQNATSNSGAGGPIVSKRVGDIELTYAQPPTPTDAPYALSTYGRMFSGMRREIFAARSMP